MTVASVPVRSARLRSSTVISSSPRYFSMIVSSKLLTRVDELVARLCGGVDEVGRDLLDLELLAHAVLPDEGPHAEDVDDAEEVGLRPDGQLDDGDGGVEAVLDHLDAAVEVRAHAVHLVDEAHPRDFVLVGLAPDGLGLGLDAGDGVEDGHRAVEDAQASARPRR